MLSLRHVSAVSRQQTLTQSLVYMCAGTLTKFLWVQASAQIVQSLRTVTEHMMKDVCVCVPCVSEVSNVC